ncbi:hypothetical protein ABZ920_27520 [Streptomyces sp. NPDC046831]|uniref:hypothetical protein n=1 Tax=Streptomyces sp. NPDC046831 TaxID=3154805 RepID=UPI0033D8EC27
MPDKRAWIKMRSRVTAEAPVGGVTGSLTSPATLLLARYDAVGTLRLIAPAPPHWPPPNGATSPGNCVRPAPTTLARATVQRGLGYSR